MSKRLLVVCGAAAVVGVLLLGLVRSSAQHAQGGAPKSSIQGQAVYVQFKQPSGKDGQLFLAKPQIEKLGDRWFITGTSIIPGVKDLPPEKKWVPMQDVLGIAEYANLEQMKAYYTVLQK